MPKTFSFLSSTNGAAPTKWKDIGTEQDKIGYLRAKAINCLIDQTITQFQNHSAICWKVKLETSLIDGIPKHQKHCRTLFKISKEKMCRAQEVIEIEAAGFQVLGGLLEAFLAAANDIAQKGEKKASAKSQTLFYLLPQQFRVTEDEGEDLDLRTLKVTDYISGMTDSFAVSLYKQLTGNFSTRRINTAAFSEHSIVPP